MSRTGKFFVFLGFLGVVLGQISGGGFELTNLQGLGRVVALILVLVGTISLIFHVSTLFRDETSSQVEKEEPKIPVSEAIRIIGTSGMVDGEVVNDLLVEWLNALPANVTMQERAALKKKRLQQIIDDLQGRIREDEAESPTS